MSLPDFILNNFRWKLSALILAVFVWFSIKQTGRIFPDTRIFKFSKQPVLVLSRPGDSGVYRITPATVDVAIRSTATALNRITEADIRVFVKALDITNAASEARKVSVHTPEGVQVFDVRVEPEAVTVERLDLSK